MSIDSGAKELPQPQSLSLAIRRGAETGSASDSLAVLDQIEREAPTRRMVLAKFGFTEGQDGYDTRVYVLPSGQTISKPVESTVFTLFTAFGPKQVIIDNPENLKFMERAINENFVVLGPNKRASKQSVAHYQKTGDEQGERQSLNDRGAVDNQGILNPQGTELQIGLLRFRGNEITHNPPKQALNDAVMYDVTRYNL